MVGVIPELRCHEKFAARDATFTDGFSNGLLGSVSSLVLVYPYQVGRPNMVAADEGMVTHA